MISRLFSRWKSVIVITLLTKFVLITVSTLANPGTTNIFYPWVRWDGPHYIDIAKNGYQATGKQSFFIVFYPLYPLLIRLLNFIVGDLLVSAIFVSILFSFIASIALFELTLLDFSKRVAVFAAWFLNIYPTAYFLQASYNESLFLTLSLITIYFFRKRRFLLTSIVGVLSTMVRVNGLLIIPLLLMEAKMSAKSLVTLLVIPLGFLPYLLINFVLFKNPFYFFRPLYLNWYKTIQWPWIGISNLINSIPKITDPNFYIYFSELITIIFILFMGLWIYFKLRKSYGIYILLNLLLMVSTKFILSTPRYSLILFPIFIALANIKNSRIIILISIIFISLLIYFTYLYTQGRWAF